MDPERDRFEVSGDMDVIEGGPRHEPPQGRRPLVLLGVLLVLASAAGGFLAGHRQSPSAVPRPQPSASPVVTVVNNVVVGTGNRCAVQLGDQWQLGIEVANRSAAAVTLRQVRANLPLGGLQPTATAWGTCGQVRPVQAGGTLALAAGATTWLTITFDVLDACPGALPALFELEYTLDGRDGVSNPGGFVDLGDVPYSRCSAN